MNTLTILVVLQVCLVQNVFSQCTSRAAVAADPFIGPGIAPYGLGGPLAYDGLAGWGASPYGYRGGYADIAYPGTPYPGIDIATYGGVGEGNVVVAGELPVAGTTAIAGQVPIMGAVRFGGEIPAAGAVSISGKCSCGCGNPYDYFY